MTDSKQPREKPAAPVFSPSPASPEQAVPEYLNSLYHRCYFDMTFSSGLDGEWMAKFTTFFFMNRLTRCVTDEVFEGQRVLQMGISSGNFEREIAGKMNQNGVYHIEDISPIRLIACKNKLAPWTNVTFEEKDVGVSNKKRYNVVVCFFLLHEMPDPRKRDAVARALDSLLPDGRVIFVDYNRPSPFNPLGYAVKWFNRMYEPFAESLWDNEIQSFAKNTDRFIWDKKTFCGGLYQCVIAQKK
ncbi:MAG: rhodoquinone biosynthesis methyltransferase RquA [Alphaproteobacteria bacterium]|jgi:SAM-dependent methyltransferase